MCRKPCVQDCVVGLECPSNACLCIINAVLFRFVTSRLYLLELPDREVRELIRKNYNLNL